jgi:tetratricopeptide (TPR) repeat protein
MLISNNPFIQNPTRDGLRTLWLQGYAGIYMPLTYTWWMGLERLADLWGPGVHHAGNILLFSLSAIGVHRLLDKLTSSGLGAFVGTLLWIVHPMQVESVAWVSEAKGLLALALGIWAINFHLDAMSDSSSRMAGIAQGLYLLALLAKPWAVALPGMVMVLDLVWYRRPINQTMRSLLPWILLGGGLIAITSYSQSPLSRVEVAPLDRLIVTIEALRFYVQKLVWPYPLGPDYGLNPPAVLSSTSMTPILAAVAFGVMIMSLIGIAKWISTKLTAAIILFIAALLPVLGLIPFGFQEISTVADRYAHAALIGPAIAIAWLIVNYRWWVTVPALFIVGFFWIATLFQIPVWKSDDTLIAQALQVHPASGTFLNNRSALRLQRGDWTGAEQDALLAMKDRPRLTSIYFNLASSQAKQRRIDEAIETLKNVYAFEPNDRRTTETIIAIYVNEKRYADAIEYARRLVDKVPTSLADKGRLARLLIVSGQEKEGIPLLAESLQTDLDPPKDVLAIAQVYEQMNEHAEAIRWYETLLQRAGGFRAAKRRLAWLLATSPTDSLRDPARSLKLARELTTKTGPVTPTDLDVLAAALAANGQFEEATQVANDAIKRAQELGDSALAAQALVRKNLYQQGKEFRSSSTGADQ